MATAITVTIGINRVTELLDLNDLEALRLISKSNAEVERAMSVFFDESRAMQRDAFLDAVDVLLTAASGLCAAIYYVYATPMPGCVPKGTSSALGGVRIGEDVYHICGGVDECTLERYHKNDSGAWDRISIEDIRSVRVIESDNMGQIEIRKRSKATALTRSLRRIKKALNSSGDDVVVAVS